MTDRTATEVRSKQGDEAGRQGMLVRLQNSHVYRTWQHHGQRRGAVLASGMAYTGLFSVFGALATGFTVFALLLGRSTELYGQVVAAVDDALPGLLDVGPDGGAVSPDDLVTSTALSWAGLVATVTTLVAGLGWLDAAREGIRAMFDVGTLQGNVVVKKVRDLGVLATLGLVLVLSAVLSLVVGAAAGQLVELAGLDGSTVASVVLQVSSVLVVFVVDCIIFVVLFRLLSGLRLSWPELRTGVLIGAAGLGILKRLAGLLLGQAGSGNPLLATGAVLVGLLVWLNLVSRLTLLAASFVATTVHDPQPSSVRSPTTARGHAVTGPSGRPLELGPREALMPTFGQRSANRTAVAAGIVMGGVAVTALRVVGSGAATVLRSVRGS